MLDFAGDLVIDIPKLWDFLGEISAPALSSGALHMGPFFEETASALRKNTDNNPNFSGKST